jgi:Rrf2 family iron-sulfur cluster assembly transcriptional regulator
MIDVGLRANAGPVSLADISTRHRISLSYLEQLFSKLRQHGLVVSTRGPRRWLQPGPPCRRDFSVADIVGAVEGAGRDGDENEHAMSEEAGAAAMTAELWATLNAKMMTYLQSITLETLVSEQRARGVEVERKPARRGIYKQPQSEPVRPTTPNSVFALGGLLLSGPLNLCPARTLGNDVKIV